MRFSFSHFSFDIADGNFQVQNIAIMDPVTAVAKTIEQKQAKSTVYAGPSFDDLPDVVLRLLAIYR